MRPGRLEGRRVYRGRILDVSLDRVRFPDGSEGELETIRHPGAAAVIPLYPPGDGSGHAEPTVLLLRQYRYAAGGFIWEIPAGKLDREGEDPEACARRELEEEAGVRAGEVVALTRIYTTPGFTDEVIHLFLARDLRPGERALEETEFIERHRVPVTELRRMVRRREIVDGKTLCALLYAMEFGALEPDGEPGG